MKKFSIIAAIVFLSFIFFASPTLGYSGKLVLGDQAPVPVLPPTVEGPGFILPDSPFVGLDHLKQNIRLLIAVNPETKAKVYSDIAGERMAELRIMLDRKNGQGVETSLEAIAMNYHKAAEELKNGQLAGRDMSAVAKTINDSIKEKQKSLDILEQGAEGGLAFEVKATQKEILIAKINVEENLPQHELENAVREDIQRLVASEVANTVEAARSLEMELQLLEAQLADASKNALAKREEAVKKAIAEKNDALRKTNEQLLARETAKQNQLKAVQKEAANQARKAIQDAQKAALTLQKSQQTLNTLRNTSIEDAAVAGASDTKKVESDSHYSGINIKH